ncbi:hypothetical protein [Snodgrassella alvi]|uniref:hypothetical protein n=1 Tax=Snodgrassella alvi TaxID=1196083 RepID=UPI000C1E568A|nr:hypothetical protein [Snodgrassella alvi]PIT21769.1 hypothetical protein BGI34_00750 [Snodgrassella alvi]
MAKLIKDFKCILPGQLYPTLLKAGEECPPEHEQNARKWGCLPPEGVAEVGVEAAKAELEAVKAEAEAAKAELEATKAQAAEAEAASKKDDKKNGGNK